MEMLMKTLEDLERNLAALAKVRWKALNDAIAIADAFAERYADEAESQRQGAAECIAQELRDLIETEKRVKQSFTV
jgi:hypothetical protein